MVRTFLKLFSIICVTNLAKPQLVIKVQEAGELTAEFETAYCGDKDNLVPCNEPLGKVCMNKQCVHACSGKSLQSCTCPSSSPCTICCLNSQGFCLSGGALAVLDRSNQRWYRQSTPETCVRQNAGYGPVCPLTDDGKVCDLTYNPGTRVEEPQICIKGTCVRPRCNLLQVQGTTVNMFVDCGCRDIHKNYPFCCRHLTNDTCSPYQWWLRQYASNYLSNIGSSEVTQQSFNPCTSADSEGKQCGPKSVCKSFQCQHACGSGGVSECICSPYTTDECHICCIRNGRCTTVNVNLNVPKIIRPVGTACNFTYGTCGVTGKCVSMAQHPSDEFCKDLSRESQRCGDMSVCRSQKCVHMCGTADQECQCAPGSPNECHVCCIQNGQCRSIYDGSRTYLLQPSGTQCNFTYGTCDRYGNCIALQSHPSAVFCKQFANDGVQCGFQQICRNNQCEHICQAQDKMCICPPGSPSECHICCVKSDGVCRSSYDGVSTFLLRPQGTACNFTYGICGSTGICTAVANHPSRGSCQGPDSDLKPCGVSQQCFNGQCQHVCGSQNKACFCQPGSADECHVCCIDDGGTCTSIFTGGLSHLLRTPGTSCNYTFGTCNAEGKCDKLQVHPSQRQCDFIENEGNECGPQMICRNFLCQHICGSSNQACQCPAEGAEECHICCLTGNSLCQSVYSGRRKFLLQKVGSACNYTKGTCDQDGRCIAVANFCALAENNKKQCRGPKFECLNGACVHVCEKEDNECICEAASGQECDICCMKEGNCTSIRNNETTNHLVRPFGSPCNFTMGICMIDGACESILSHPFYDILNNSRAAGRIVHFFVFVSFLAIYAWMFCRYG